MAMTAFNPTLSIENLVDVIRTNDWCDLADKDQMVDLILLSLSDDDAEETEKVILDLSSSVEPEEVEQFLLGEYAGFEEDSEEEPFEF